MGLAVYAPPAQEPFTLEEVKDFIRVTHSHEDILISNLITIVRRQFEEITGFAAITQTWDLALDRFPSTPSIEMPKPPLQSIVSITYIDQAGATQTMPPADYIIDTVSIPGRLSVAFGKYWPSARMVLNAATIRFICGYGADGSAIPQDKREGMLLLIGNYYENRQTLVLGRFLGQIPEMIMQLWSDRVYVF